jgi:hypothetical protein
MAHAVADDDVGAFRVKPAVDHRPVDRVHQVGAHQPIDIAELLLEDVSPLRRPDRLSDAAQLPGRDGIHIARHQPEFVFEASDDAGVGARKHT